MKFPIPPHMQQVPFPPISEVQHWLDEGLYSDAEPLIDLCQAVPRLRIPTGGLFADRFW